MLIESDKAQQRMRTATLRHILDKGVSTEQELWFLLTEGLGVLLPHETCCEEHQSLWEPVKADFFHRDKNQAIRHARGGGKTLSVAGVKAAKILVYPGLRVANFAATEFQGTALYGYVQQFLGPGSDPAIQERVDQLFGSVATTHERPVRGRVKPASSRMTVLVGTVKGVNSAHVDDLVVDERAQMADEVFKEAMGMMTAAPPYPGVLTVLSTVKAHRDPMDLLLQEAEERGFAPYTSCILDVMYCQERSCDGCKSALATTADKRETKSFYDYCRGRLMGRKLGHVSVETAKRKFSGMGLEAAEAQLFCLAPHSEERAFPAWSHENEINLDEQVKAQYVNNFWVFGDFGKSDDSVFLKAYYLPRTATIYVAEEETGSGLTIDEWVVRLREKGWGNCLAFLVDVAGRQTSILSKKSAIDHLEDAGWNVVSEAMDELASTDRLRDLIKARRFVVNPSMAPKTAQAFTRATNQSIGTGDNKKFLKVVRHNKFSHPVDAARYGTNLLSPEDGEQNLPQRYTRNRR